MHSVVFFLYLLLSFSLFAKPDFYKDIYQKNKTEVVMMFSTHTTTAQDNELKRLWRILDGEVTERQKDHLKKQVEAKLNRQQEALFLEKELLSLIKNSHLENPFKGVLAEFSEEKRDRYLLRINVASFVRSRLHELVDLERQKIDDYLLLLTGEDIFPLLKGNFLASVPLIATENHELQQVVGAKIAACKGMMGVLGLGQSEESQYASTLLEPFYRPDPELFDSYLETKAEAYELFMDNALLRLRVGISSQAEVAKNLDNCDALFDKRRDEFVVSILKTLPEGKFLLTRGIAHRHLLVNLPELR